VLNITTGFFGLFANRLTAALLIAPAHKLPKIGVADRALTITAGKDCQSPFAPCLERAPTNTPTIARLLAPIANQTHRLFTLEPTKDHI
jgi:hypothetical protein